MHHDLPALNKQAIAAAKAHMGHIAWPTIALTALVVSLFVANLWLFATGVMPLWASIILYAALTYMSYTPLHEAAHGNIHGSHARLSWLNAVCGHLVAPLIMVPYASHTVEHFTHHRHTNQADKDPDYVVKRMGDGPVTFLLTACHFLWIQNTFLFRDYWATASLRERAVFCAELLVSLGWRVAFVALVGRETDLLLLVVGYLAGASFTAYWFAYRPHLPYAETARYRNTNSLIMPRWMKPLEWFWFGQNLHSVHHLFPRVPFYRYHALHRQIEPILRAHGTPIIGLFNRHPIAAVRPTATVNTGGSVA
jgi:beta-carotene hydroxylase